MKKAPEAFRTISEVAEILETPAHVLRFWESKFYQIRPVKRAGGRRYYRPDDVALINGIRTLLQDQGMTIRGVQRILQESGVKHVTGLGSPVPTGQNFALDPAQDSGQPADNDSDDDLIEDAILVTSADDDALPEPVFMTEDDAAIPDDSDSVPAPDGQAVADIVIAAPDLSVPEAPPVQTPAVFETLRAAVEPPDIIAAPVAVETVKAPLAPRIEAVASDRSQIARNLRLTPRGSLGPRRDRLNLLARRIDSLLERMSEASGAGRW